MVHHRFLWGPWQVPGEFNVAYTSSSPHSLCDQSASQYLLQENKRFVIWGKHIIRYIAPSKEQLVVPIRKTKWCVMCHSWHSLGVAWSAAISLLCCPCGQAAPWFHLSAPQTGGAHRPCVSQTLCWPGCQGGPELSPGDVRCGSSPPDTTEACSAFQHS